MRLLFALLFIAFSGGAWAQGSIPFKFISEDDNRLIKETDSVKYFVATGDTDNIVSLNEESLYYRLLNRDRKVVAEGPYIVEGDKFFQEGRWVERFANGKVKLTGVYRKGLTIGTWQKFYSDGKLKTIYNYGIFNDNGAISSCLSGTYQEYYQNGELKVSGFYCAKFSMIKDTIEVVDPVTGEKIIKTTNRNVISAAKTGHWEYFNEAGDLERKEDI
jgi:antitoxin component YwqK of YwqJK toxin-antitoxin module